MKGTWKKIVSALCCLTMAAVPLAGCSHGSDPGNQSAGTDPSKLAPATVTLYMVSDEPKDTAKVVAKLNELFKKELNTTIAINFTSWTDYTQKYDLALKSGGDIDLVYTANWMSYAQYAGQGAFLDLDDLLPKYAPKVWKMIDSNTWDQVKVKQKIYAVPSPSFVYDSKGIAYRADLCKKYSLPVPDSAAHVEEYLLGVKKNLPNQKLYGVYPEQNPSGEPFSANTMLMNFRYPLVNEEFSSYGLVSRYDQPDKLINYWGSDGFVEDMKTLRRWCTEGFWSKDVLSAKNNPDDFNMGEVVLSTSGLNPAKVDGARQQLAAQNKDWQADYFPFAKLWGYARYATPMSNMTSIPYTCKNPERALMVLEKLMTDQRYYTLLQYGIEGTHYTVKDGCYNAILNKNGDDDYSQGAFAWGFENPKLAMKVVESDFYKNQNAALDKLREKTPFHAADISGGFQEDYSDYQAQRAALGNVISEYLTPLEAGMVPDVDKGVAQFRAKAKEAGLDAIQAAYAKEWASYCDEHNYH